MPSATEYLSCADTAKLLRKALKANFPDYPARLFSVRSSTYADGASIDVSWTDGPPVPEVGRICDVYTGADFDGMIDLKTYRDPTVLAGENGELREVSFGADFIFTNRSYTEPTYRAVLKRMERFGPITPEPIFRPAFKSNPGVTEEAVRLTNTLELSAPGAPADSFARMFNRALNRASVSPEGTITLDPEA